MSTINKSDVVVGNLVDMYSQFKLWPKANFIKCNGVIRCESEIPSVLFNTVIKTDLPQSDIEEWVDRLTDEYTNKSLPFCWNISSSCKPENMSDYLVKADFTLIATQSGMSLNIEKFENLSFPEGFSVLEVNCLEDMDFWSDVFAKGYQLSSDEVNGFTDWFVHLGFGGRSRVKHFIGFDYGKPVCTSTLFLGKESAGVYCVSTIPSARKKGFGTAISLVCLYKAKFLGYQVASLISSQEAESIYLNVGFQRSCLIDTYLYIE